METYSSSSRERLQLRRAHCRGPKTQDEIEAIRIRAQLKIALRRPGRFRVEEFLRARRRTQPCTDGVGVEMLAAQTHRQHLRAQVILSTARR